MGGEKESNKEVSRMMHPEEYGTMALAERNHWWYKTLHNQVLRTLEKFFSNKSISIIDAACGTGGLTVFLNENGYANIRGFDLSEAAVKFCKEKGLNVFQGDINKLGDYYSAGSADVVVCNDALYFLNGQQQRQFTDSAYRILNDNGLLIMNVPALNAFKGMHDIRVGIVDRFNKDKVKLAFDAGRYKLLIQLYWPFSLSPLIWASRFGQRMKMKWSENAEIKSDVDAGTGMMNSFLFHIANGENALISKKPFGSSLFIVLRKQKAIN